MPNGGQCDHVEPMYGIFSNHPLNDTEVYDDDWIVHASDQDYMPYYRPMNSLEDDLSMQGNCKHAGRGFGKNEMYPCFDKHVTYGLAVTGLAVKNATLYPDGHHDRRRGLRAKRALGLVREGPHRQGLRLGPLGVQAVHDVPLRRHGETLPAAAVCGCGVVLVDVPRDWQDAHD